MKEGVDYKNPFAVPDDSELFTLREEDKRQKEQEKAEKARQHVWEKTTSASRRQCTQVPFSKDLLTRVQEQELRSVKKSNVPKLGVSEKFPGGNAPPAAARREKEDIASFVAKKREMFLVQMSLDVKKAEIEKLDEKVRLREEALKKSQQMLEEDVSRFDAFLQSNDAKAHKAMKTAEDLTKKKQEKMQRIKQLKSQTSAIHSEISKHREQKEECEKYKKFLEDLTPADWTKAQQELRENKKERKKSDWVEDRHLAQMNKMGKEIDAVQQQFDAEMNAMRGKKSKQKEQEEGEKLKELERRKKNIKKQYPTIDQLREEYDATIAPTIPEEEEPLYFKDVQQLLDIFATLEESNLFLIQNSQETEQTIEELHNQLEAAEGTFQERSAKLQADINDIQTQINSRRARIEDLKTRTVSKDTQGTVSANLKQVSSEVSKVFGDCGFDAGHDVDALKMLGACESRLEELLESIDDADPEFISALEKKFEKERRERVRQQRVAYQKEKADERLRNSLLRSQAPVHKKIGKQIMFRSPPCTETAKVQDTTDESAIMEEQIRVFGIICPADEGADDGEQ